MLAEYFVERGFSAVAHYPVYIREEPTLEIVLYEKLISKIEHTRCVLSYVVIRHDEGSSFEAEWWNDFKAQMRWKFNVAHPASLENLIELLLLLKVKSMNRKDLLSMIYGYVNEESDLPTILRDHQIIVPSTSGRDIWIEVDLEDPPKVRLTWCIKHGVVSLRGKSPYLKQPFAVINLAQPDSLEKMLNTLKSELGY